MTFTVRDLMLDVLPAADAEGYLLGPCLPITDLPKPKPGPKPGPHPKPKPKPECMPISTGPDAYADDLLVAGARLAPLSALREQLHQALHP